MNRASAWAVRGRLPRGAARERCGLLGSRSRAAFILALVSWLTTSCAPGAYRAFDGERTVAEVAQVKGELIQVGAKRVPSGTERAELLPGDHSLVFYLDYMYETSPRSALRIQSHCGVEAKLVAGRSYEVRVFADPAVSASRHASAVRLYWGAGLFDTASSQMISACRCLTDQKGEWRSADCDDAYGPFGLSERSRNILPAEPGTDSIRR